MKKKIVTVKNFTAMTEKISKAKKQIKNELTEDAAELRRSLLDLLDELENAEIEVDEAELASRVREMIDAYNRDAENEVPASVANAIASKFAELQNRMPANDKLTPAVKNQVAAAILRSRNKTEIENAVNAVLVKNGITGLTFEAAVDYAINEAWGDSNRLFAALRKTPFSKFFYSSQDVDDADVIAHGWDKTSATEKEIQALTVNGKTITTQYIYKRQQVAQEDLDDMRESNSEATFLRWLNDELDRQIVNAIIHVMLGSTSYSDITTIESLFGLGTSDAFRTAVTPTSGASNKAALKLEDLRALADNVANPNGKAKWLVIDQTTLTQIAAFIYATGGDTMYHDIDTLKGFIGVEEIYVTSLADEPVVFIPDGYWVKEKNAISVSYPTWEFNVMNYQKERNIGAAIHDLKSVAFFDY